MICGAVLQGRVMNSSRSNLEEVLISSNTTGQNSTPAAVRNVPAVRLQESSYEHYDGQAIHESMEQGTHIRNLCVFCCSPSHHKLQNNALVIGPL